MDNYEQYYERDSAETECSGMIRFKMPDVGTHVSYIYIYYSYHYLCLYSNCVLEGDEKHSYFRMRQNTCVRVGLGMRRGLSGAGEWALLVINKQNQNYPEGARHGCKHKEIIKGANEEGNEINTGGAN